MQNDAVAVARNSSYFLIQTIVSTLIQVIVFAIIYRLVTQVDLGVLATATLLVSLSTTLAGLGLSSATTKFVAEHVGRGDREAASGVCFHALRVSFFLSIIMASIAFLLSDWISILLLKSTQYAVLIRILSFDIILAGVFPTLNGVLVGLQKIRQAAAFNLLRLLTRQGLIIAFLFGGLGLSGIVVAWVFGDLVNCLLFLSVIFAFFGSPKFNFSLRQLLRFSYPLYASEIIVFAYGWFDQALLLALLPLDQLGVYSVVLRAFAVLEGIAAALSTTLFPKYSEINGRQGVKWVESAVAKASRYVCYIIMPLAFGLLAVARPAILLLAGDSYAGGSLPLMILSLSFAVTSVQMALSGLFLILKETKIASALTVTNAGVGIAFGFLLLPSFGVVGATMARGATMILGLALSLLVLRKKMNIRLDKEAYFKSLISSLTMVGAVGAFTYLSYSPYFLPFYMLVAFLTYFVMLRALKAVKRTDLELIRTYLGKRLGFLYTLVEALFSWPKKTTTER